MANRKCIYLTEGECEAKLVRALQEAPALVRAGKVKRFNVIQNELPASILMTFDPGSTVILIFDTDTDFTEHLKVNLDNLRKQCAKVEVLTVAQVHSFEEELEHATDVTKAQDLTQSESVSEFKSAVNRMNTTQFRRTLENHHLDISKLWSKRPPKAFAFLTQGSDLVKTFGKQGVTP